MPHTTSPTATSLILIAFSYIRFSHPDQAKGDSLRRQTEEVEDWCLRNGVHLDTSMTLRDLGKSAFSGTHRQNPDRNALAAFLKLVEKGKVPRGSYLVIENLDRLSREHIQPALLLVLNLLQAGVRIVQLKPVEMVFDDKSDTLPVMMMMMELSRGHGESVMKSERVGAAWEQKKQAAALSKTPVTRRLPAWLSVQGERFAVDETKAAVVRRIYRMAAGGFGVGAITSRLNAEKVPPIARADYWARSYVAKLLSNRAVLGEYQPHTRRGGIRRKADGGAIPNYFPTIVTEEEFHAARAALLSRINHGGRPPVRKVNIFANLLRDARDGGSLHQVDKGKESSGILLVNYKATLGVKGTKNVSFPLEVFERSVLSQLREIDPRELLPQEDGAADKVLTLTGQLAEIEGRMEQVKGQLIDGGDLAPLVQVLRALEAKRTAAADELAEAKRAAASPLSGAWGEFGSLTEALDNAPDQEDARTRLRGALRRMVESVWCLFIARGAWRLAAVQVWFAGGGRRDYLVVRKGATGGSVGSRPAQSRVWSLVDVVKPGDLDLRQPANAAKLEALLSAVDLSTVAIPRGDSPAGK